MAKASLPDRIRALRDECDEFIAAKAKKLAQAEPGVPYHVLRNLLTSRTHGCVCAAVLNNSEPA